MATSSTSTIAQLLCSQTLPVNFAQLIREVDLLLEPFSASAFKIGMDSDLVATFDQPGTRILLAWSQHPGQGLSGVLTLSVGPSSVLGKPLMRPDHQALAAHLTQHLLARTLATDILWHQMACWMTSDWVDLLIDALPDLATLPALKTTTPAPLPLRTKDSARHFGPDAACLAFPTTHHPADRDFAHDSQMDGLRTALNMVNPQTDAVRGPMLTHVLLSGFNLVLLPWGLVSLAQAALYGS